MLSLKKIALRANRVKEKAQRAREPKGKGLQKNPGSGTNNTKTVAAEEVEAGARRIATAIGRAAILRIVDPRTTPHDSISTFFSFRVEPCTAIDRGIFIIIMPVVFAPFPNVAMHIV